jgi:hypothetical protein
MLFASQLGTSSPAAIASLVGADLCGSSSTPPAALYAVTDVETGWTHSRAPTTADLSTSAPAAAAAATAVSAPFCTPQKEQGVPPYYIKTGGNPADKVGWAGGDSDKCCQIEPAACRWFGSLAQCQAALNGNVTCVPCSDCSVSSDGCPSWSSGCPPPPSPPPPLGLTLRCKPRGATTVVEATAVGGTVRTPPTLHRCHTHTNLLSIVNGAALGVGCGEAGPAVQLSSRVPLPPPALSITRTHSASYDLRVCNFSFPFQYFAGYCSCAATCT